MADAAPVRDGTVFDRVATEYDRSRPTYPAELVDRACRLAGIGSGDRVLEVGCGTGQLTGSLLARGLRVTALEPGRRLMSLAEQNLSGRGDVEFVNARFEDADLPRSRFQAVFSASAFHWIDPEVAWHAAARALVPGGTLALIQYCGLRDPRTEPDQRALLSALASIAPEIAADWPVYRNRAGIVAGALRRRRNVSDVWAWVSSHDVARAHAAGLFSDVEIATVPTVLEQTPDELNRLVRTLSFYAHISSSQRQAIEGENIALYERLGRPIRSSIVTVLVTARGVSSDPEWR
jgi:SAM-dependent methyltransferase